MSQILKPPTQPAGESRFLLRFSLAVAVVAASATGLAWLLIALVGSSPEPGVLIFPPAFSLSTILLFFGSISVHRALAAVRRERQHLFRRHLFTALTAGVLFCGVQTYALYSLVQNQLPGSAQQDASAFLIVMATLHGMHFCVAVLFLTYVTTRALLDRYDHEYFLGVTVCTYFWHALGVLWFIILAVFLIALGMQ